MSRPSLSLEGPLCPAVQSLRMLATAGALVSTLIAVAGTGCSGINATKSVSPLDFILPGLMLNRPPPSDVPPPAETATLLAQAGRVPLQQP